MKKILGFLGFCGLWASAQAQAVLTNTPDKVNDLLDGVADNTITLFDKVVPVIIAVVGLGILIAFVKMIRKR